MAKRFNEAEEYLLRNWQQACSLEKSMKEVRRRYSYLCDQVLEFIQDKHKNLDRCKNSVKSGGDIYIGREIWQTDGNYSCISAVYLDLESLSDAEVEQPFIGIYTGEQKKPALNIEAVRKLCVAAQAILTKDQLIECSAEEGVLYGADNPSKCVFQYQLYYYLPKKADLLHMLCNGEGQPFVDCLVEHFNVFAKFIPVLDEIYSKPGK